MALGAERTHVIGMVVRSGLGLVMVGMGVGIAISLTLGRVIGAQLVGVRAYDPETIAATTLLLMMTAAIACWIPARRAARVDPVIALRYQ
jgi:ABC-type antimicrobial peptide transport system permease subunit